MFAANDAESAGKFYRASMVLRVPITSFLEKHPPDCVIVDFIQSWVHDFPHRITLCSKPPKGVTGFLERLLKTEMKMQGTRFDDASSLRKRLGVVRLA
ncbi:hypothetical protein LR48_Vigan03g121000 [Vigna angularis]|uniref:Uncharacterized protein n=1 Tax=Phaseolus angularis TaxID=3914 RepID=A0A0L9U4S8_PHAAN|nr:hypothetical protein LR48_Vigan03g121000 [Vigna angularis]